MKNIRGHKINIPSEIVEVCWSSYKERYSTIESSISSASDSIKTPSFVYDSGAFVIQERELQYIGDTVLKDFFFGLKYKNRTIQLGKKYLLRGLEYYIGMVKEANQIKLEKVFDSLKSYINTLKSVSIDENFILYLGFLDNLKNYLFISLYALNQISRELGYIDEESLSVNEYNKLLSLIGVIEFSFTKTYLTKKIYLPDGIENFISVIEAVYEYTSKRLPSVERNKKIQHKLIRKSREADNFAKMIHLAKKVSNEFIRPDTLMVGVEYGGIELPFIINAYREFVGKSQLNFITLNLSNYSNTGSRYVDSIKYSISPFFQGGHLKSSTGVLILDDSISTGRTVDILVNFLPKNIEEIFLACNTFKVSHRYHHLTRKDHGGINPLVAANSLFGYLSDYVSTYTKDSYTNKHGTFDKMKRRIEKLMTNAYSDSVILDI